MRQAPVKDDRLRGVSHKTDLLELTCVSVYYRQLTFVITF